MNITDKIFWENNSRVKNSNFINSSKIIKKSATHLFPCDSITIRMDRLTQKNTFATAYFHGKSNRQTSSWSGQTYSIPSSKLMVTFSKEEDNFIFNGCVSKDFSLQDVTDVVSYCKDILNKL